mmetsp:Transcript_13001/g.36877  ORF Transcript_13001/g.36877 Transcript_13001/m.36877 type:complete len:104 (+) Transcript_13001:840-1151(+)
MLVIVPMFTSLPCEEFRTFTTSRDNQDECIIEVYEGNRAFARDCTFLGCFALRGIPPGKAGIPQIRVSFKVSRNGTLAVEAQCTSSPAGQSAGMTVTLSVSRK